MSVNTFDHYFFCSPRTSHKRQFFFRNYSFGIWVLSLSPCDSSFISFSGLRTYKYPIEWASKRIGGVVDGTKHEWIMPVCVRSGHRVAKYTHLLCADVPRRCHDIIAFSHLILRELFLRSSKWYIFGEIIIKCSQCEWERMRRRCKLIQ